MPKIGRPPKPDSVELRRARQRAKRKWRRDFILQAKSRPCADCGGTFPYFVMEFDHRPGETKLEVIAKCDRRGNAFMLAEIAKCDVVCANCHRYRTYARAQHQAS